MAMRQFGGGTGSGEQQQQQSGGGCDGGNRELVLVGPVQMVRDGEKNNNKNKNKKEQVEELVEEVVRRCWRWLVSNSWVLVILLVFATMEARSELQHLLMAVELVAAALLQNVVAAVTVVCCLMSLAFIFMFGVSTGLWWRARRQKKTEEKEDLQSKMLMQIEDQLPQSSSSEVKNNPMFSPAARVMVSLSPMASGLQVGNLVKQYTLKEIVSMTNSFEKELGRGGQGIVYAAMLPAMLPGELEVPAAVKKLQRPNAGFLENPEMPMQQQQATLEKEFWVELRTISRLHHGNLVALLGYCVEGQELFLIYELMSNGSLDQHLHECDSGAAAATFLDWKARIRVAIEVAQGLEYLHRHAHPTLVHRDIKSSNILFDDDMQAKIADFGLSKVLILGHDPTASHRLRGTAGYVDPHYLRTGQAVDKNDVYSYGVLLLELITGRRAIQKKLSLVTWCKEFLTSDQSLLPVLLPRMVDRGILPAEYSLEQLQNVVKVARACLDDSPERRPSMKEVLIALYNSESKDISSSDFSFEGPPVVEDDRLSSGGRQYSLTNGPSLHSHSAALSPTSFRKGHSSYEIKENTIIVKAMVDNLKIAMRCKIWPTPKNFGLNKVEVTSNGAFLWKKGLWWFNARSSREFTVDDHIMLIAQWHVTLRTSRTRLAPSDPRRSQGPFCVEYLALKDIDGNPLIEYHGDQSPLLPVSNVTTSLQKKRQQHEICKPVVHKYNCCQNWNVISDVLNGDMDTQHHDQGAWGQAHLRTTTSSMG
ncbi:unnamed protein product [Sphagnum jensenii]|uniref:Protein kinase domain-containing protein n=1 Tax=Sphagnum jensenii TaxID=128206 RepID=A0ABP1BVW1_9BRYO